MVSGSGGRRQRVILPANLAREAGSSVMDREHQARGQEGWLPGPVIPLLSTHELTIQSPVPHINTGEHSNACCMGFG